jgi:hypothetical protein
MFLIALAFTAPSAVAQDGLGGALSEAAKGRNLMPDSLGIKIATADFDSDQQPDGAVLLDEGQFEGRRFFRIRLHFTAGQDNDLTFQSNETSLAISALDVNQDGVPDLVVEQIFTHKRLQVWLNDGHGRFRQARVEDFPPMSEAPCKWKAPIVEPSCLVLALPSRSEKNQAALLLQVLRFNSSSSHSRARPDYPQVETQSLALPSSRAPPLFRLI